MLNISVVLKDEGLTILRISMLTKSFAIAREILIIDEFDVQLIPTFLNAS
jgi:hypothetical protein